MLEGGPHCFRFLFGSPSFLLVGFRVHGGSPATGCFAGLGVRVDDPPRTLSRSLILDPHKATVK